MPEGDTIHTIARAMNRWIDGGTIESVRIEGRVQPDLAGNQIERVRARGKHLVIELEGSERLRTHLGMTGSWHRYDAAARWEKPASAASLCLRTDGQDYVCFHAAEVQRFRAGSLAESDLNRRLGPDLATRDADLDEVVDNALRCEHPTAGDVLLEQRVAAGIGNVYKSELLFLAGLHPETASGSVTEAEWREIYGTAQRLLCANLDGGPRVTRHASQRDDQRQWAYGRVDRPCHRCATPMVRARTGKSDRRTTWCPKCQAPR